MNNIPTIDYSKKTKSNIKAILILIVVILLCTFVTSNLAGFVLNNIWKQDMATITSFTVDNGNLFTRRTAFSSVLLVNYTYTYNGVQYSGSDTVFRGSNGFDKSWIVSETDKLELQKVYAKYRVGEKTQIRINPIDPKNSVLIDKNGGNMDLFKLL